MRAKYLRTGYRWKGNWTIGNRQSGKRIFISIRLAGVEYHAS